MASLSPVGGDNELLVIEWTLLPTVPAAFQVSTANEWVFCEFVIARPDV